MKEYRVWMEVRDYEGTIETNVDVEADDLAEAQAKAYAEVKSYDNTVTITNVQSLQ